MWVRSFFVFIRIGRENIPGFKKHYRTWQVESPVHVQLCELSTLLHENTQM